MAKGTKIDPNETGVVRLQGDVYNQILDAAESEERTIGGQVAYMVKNFCVHPIEYRQPRHAVVFPVFQKRVNSLVGKNQPQRGFYCAKCKTTVIPDGDSETERVEIVGTIS